MVDQSNMAGSKNRTRGVAGAVYPIQRMWSTRGSGSREVVAPGDKIKRGRVGKKGCVACLSTTVVE